MNMNMTKKLLFLLLMAACGDEGDSGNDLDAEIDRTTDVANQRARSACDAPDDVGTSDPEGDTEAGRCYYELAFELAECEREALRKEPEAARRALECALDELDVNIAECCDDGKCTYSNLDACDGERPANPSCDAAWARVEAHLGEDC